MPSGQSRLSQSQDFLLFHGWITDDPWKHGYELCWSTYMWILSINRYHSTTQSISWLKPWMESHEQRGLLYTDFFLINLFFNWRIIALQNRVGFCQTSTWISHKCMYVPFLLNLPLTPSHPLGCYGTPVWVSWVIHQMPIGYLFFIWSCKFPCYSLHTSHPPLPPQPCPRVHKFGLCVCVPIVALQVISSAPSF